MFPRIRLLFLFVCACCEAKQLNVSVSSQCALLMNAETGNILYEKNSHIERSPASTTKIATALYAIYHKGNELDSVYTCDPECLTTVTYKTKQANQFSLPGYFLEPEGTHFSMKSGEHLTLRDLLFGCMLTSGNDASNVIAKNMAKEIPLFMSQLNQFLKEIGCLHTNFVNPHGLYHPQHYSTAYDLAIMTRKALEFPLFKEIIKTKTYLRPKTNKQNSKWIRQNNLLMREGKYFYSNAVGVKTGYIKDAGYNIVAAAEGGGRVLIGVLLGAKTSEIRYREIAMLFDAAFSEVKISRTIFKWNESQFYKECPEAQGPLKASLMEDIAIEYYPSEEPDVQASIKWKNIDFPIKEGEIVGEIAILDDRTKAKIAASPLYALHSVQKKWHYRIKDRCAGFKLTYWLWAIGLFSVMMGFRVVWSKR